MARSFSGIRNARLAALASVASLVFFPAVACAQSAQRSEVNVKAQSLGEALNQVGRQTRTEIIFSPGAVRGKNAQAIHGTLSAGEAIERLLANSGLAARRTANGAYVIEAIPQGNALAGAPNAGTESASSSGEDALPAGQEGISEILVVGSRSQNVDIRRSRDDSLPYVIIEREAIEQSGAQSIEQFLSQRLSASSQYSTSSQVASQSTASTNVSLRGLGPNQTLILIDGRRSSSVADSGASVQADLTGIPIAAVDRIEVLPASASGIYGGSATGGVINVILKRDYRGIQVSAGVDGTFAGGGRRVWIDTTGGFNFNDGHTNVLFAGSYSDSNPLLYEDRSFIERRRAEAAQNNPSRYLRQTGSPPIGYTTNIRSNAPLVNGVRPDLVLKPQYGGTSLGSPFTFVPVGYDGVASDSGQGLVDNAGSYNFALADTAQDGQRRASLLNNPTHLSGRVSIRHDFTRNFEGYAEFGASVDEGHYAGNFTTGSFTLLASSPANPFQQPISVTTPLLGADQQLSSRLTHYRAVAGAIYRVGPLWSASVDLIWDRTKNAFEKFPVLLLPTTQSDIRSGVIDIFRDTNESGLNFSPYVNSDANDVRTPAASTLYEASFRLAGTLPWELPGGSVSLTALADYRKEKLAKSALVLPFFAQYYPPRSQDVASAYVEARIPIVSEQNARAGVRELEIALAGRYDHYVTRSTNTLFDPADQIFQAKNSFSSINPSVSLRFSPVEAIHIRGSFGTGFLPPSVQQIVPSSELTDLSFYTDPARGNEPIGNGNEVLVLSGGNEDLKPEDSRTYSVGFILQPDWMRGLRFSADWVKIKKRSNIADPFRAGNLPLIFDYEGRIPGLVERAPPSDGFPVGPVTALNFGPINIASQEVSAIDFALDYRFETGRLGTFSFQSTATHLIKNDSKILSTDPTQHNLGLIGYGLRWKGSGTVGWEYKNWTASWTGTFYSSHPANFDGSIDAGINSDTVPSQFYNDVFVEHTVSASPKIEIRAGIQNIFNRKPPFIAAVNPFSFYDYYGDVRLRRFSLGVSSSF